MYDVNIGVYGIENFFIEIKDCNFNIIFNLNFCQLIYKSRWFKNNFNGFFK